MNKDETWRKLKEPAPEIDDNRGRRWFLHGFLHREDGPAVIWANGSEFWYKNGDLHREDGPAVIWASGCKSWYLHDKKLSEAEFNERR